MVRTQGINLISRKKIEYIAHNHIVTKHAHKRLLQRYGKYDLRKMILDSPLSWRNTDGTINVAMNYDSYLVVLEQDNIFMVLTYKGKSNNGFNVIDKLVLGYMGIDRNKRERNKWKDYI